MVLETFGCVLRNPWVEDMRKKIKGSDRSETEDNIVRNFKNK